MEEPLLLCVEHVLWQSRTVEEMMQQLMGVVSEINKLTAPRGVKLKAEKGAQEWLLKIEVEEK